MKRQYAGITSFKYSYFLLISALLLSGCNDSSNDNSNAPDTGKKPVMRCAP
jgi:PBP1b-binding outer membrane lipoprotein LpoB